MSNALVPFKAGQVPAHILALQQAASGGASDIVARASLPTLSIKGKVWTVIADGEKIQMMARNAEGDEVPVPVLRAVIVGHARQRGRAYFEGDYNPDQEAAPLCRSQDGTRPDADVPEEDKQAQFCAKCPKSVKGSKISEGGKATVACSQHRIIVLALGRNLDRLVRLKLPITSDFDKQSPEHAQQGWHAFQQYSAFLLANSCSSTALLVTKMKFDNKATYPKVLFSADSFLDEAAATKAIELAKSQEVADLLAGVQPGAAQEASDEGEQETEGVDGSGDGYGEADGVEMTRAVEPKPAVTQTKPAPKPVTQTKPAPKPVTQTKPAPNVVAGTAASKPATAPAAPIEPEVMSAAGVGDILDDWAS